MNADYCRYKSNDYYLKQLIEEWCEGVIQKNPKLGQVSSCNNADVGGPHSLLLEKVAVHLEKKNAESLSIDLQGLTKVQPIVIHYEEREFLLVSSFVCCCKFLCSSRAASINLKGSDGILLSSSFSLECSFCWSNQ